MATLQTGKATELITFSRTSNATVTDSDGKIKWAPHNLLLASEQFDASNWAKGANVTVTANASASPAGPTTADRIATSGAAGAVSQTLSLAIGEKYKISLWAKSFGGSSQTFRLFGDTGILSSDFTATSSWQLFEFEFTVATGGSRSCGITANAAFGNYDVLVWGAHLYRSDLGGMQANTSAYPMYNPTTPKNLLGYTENFSDSYWTKLRASITANSATAPNGLFTADTLVEDNTASNNHFVQSAAFTYVTGGTYTYSCYLKAKERTWAQLEIYRDTAYNAYFNLSSGTVGTAANATAQIVSVGDGWYRCSIRFTVTTGGAGGNYVFLATADNTRSYTGDNVSGIYLWGAQLSDSASLDTYVPNYGPAPTAAAYYGPRLDFDPVTLAAKGLLVEESRANLMVRSNEFNNALWVLGGLNAFGSGSVANTTATLDPSGQNTADFIQEDSTAGALHNINANVTFASVVPHNYSCYVKAAGRSWVRLFVFQSGIVGNAVWFNLGTGQVGTVSAGASNATITSAGNGWYRCSFTFTPASASVATCYVALATADNELTYNGNGTSGLYVFGAQVEAGSFATSYIFVGATTAGATRNPDVASVGTNQFPYSATEGTLVVSASTTRPSSANVGNIASLRNDAATSVNRIFWYALKFGGSTANSGSVVADIQLNYTAGSIAKGAYAFKDNDFAFALDGTLGTPDPSGTVPNDITMMSIGSVNGSASFNGHIRQITYIPRRLSNTELQTRTA